MTEALPIGFGLNMARPRRNLLLVAVEDRQPDGGSGRGVVIVQIPARPFLWPAFKRFDNGAQKRFFGRVAGPMGMAAGPTPDTGGGTS